VNFFTKVLGRRGFATIILVSAPENTTTAVADLDSVLTGYRFQSGRVVPEWRPGDKVAEYGLTGLIVGRRGAAAVKTGLFKGLWKFLVAGIAHSGKCWVAAAVAVVAGLKSSV